MMDSIEAYRQFLKSDPWAEWDGMETDQQKGLPAPGL
jgi:hypothetical protein